MSKNKLTNVQKPPNAEVLALRLQVRQLQHDMTIAGKALNEARAQRDHLDAELQRFKLVPLQYAKPKDAMGIRVSVTTSYETPEGQLYMHSQGITTLDPDMIATLPLQIATIMNHAPLDRDISGEPDGLTRQEFLTLCEEIAPFRNSNPKMYRDIRKKRINEVFESMCARDGIKFATRNERKDAREAYYSNLSKQLDRTFEAMEKRLSTMKKTGLEYAKLDSFLSNRSEA